MKLSLSWLNDYVDVNEYFEKPEELGKLLTAAGLELEGIVNPAEQYQNIVLGKIEKLDKHANADKLTVCQVNIGSGTQQIVCGAKNHKAGDFVVAALPGAVLPGDFKIKKSKIRGEESLGMLCSEKELGLTDEADGILILNPEKHKPGAAIHEVLNLNDVVFEISVTPNRADCLSHIGLAREVSCLLDRPLKWKDPKLKFGSDSVKKTVNLKLVDSDRCPRYAGRLITGVKVGPSPQWLKSRLEAVDINSINNVVDATNYAMLEMGQPFHAFDLTHLKGSKIVIDSSKKGETFQTLDGTEIKLTGDELMIRDGERPVALAGVVGGLNSGVTEETTDLFIETAYFTQLTVRRTSRRFGIETDSAYRFARGTDPENVVTAMDRVCQLIQELAGGEASKDHYDEYPNPIKHSPIKIELSFLEQKMGYDVDPKEFESWMKRLGCEVKGKKGKYEILPPAWRWDLSMDVDLVEEFARLHGYDKIEETLPVLSYRPQFHNDQYEKERLLERLLMAQGCSQAMNYHFINGDEQLKVLGDISKYKGVGLDVSAEPVPLRNPLNEDVNCMRVSLIPGLVKNLVGNFRHGNASGRLYEIGSVFQQNGDAFNEHFHLGFCFWGQNQSHWNSGKDAPCVYDLREAVVQMLNALKITGWEWKNLETSEVPAYLHPGQAIALKMEGKVIGVFGSLHPNLVAQHKIRTSVAMGEFDFAKLMDRQPRFRKFESISRFQRVERDLAFVMPENIDSQQVEKAIRKHAGPLLSNIAINDVYQGDKLEKGHRSVAYRMTFKPKDKTFGETELQTIQDNIISGVNKTLGIQIRN